jgi:histidine triad (HIT) family protein
MHVDTGSGARCIFCKIVARRMPADEVLRDEHVVAFRDIHPVAPTHILVVPTMHAAHLSDFVKLAGAAASARLLKATAEIGARFGEGGYRVVTNEGADAGQSVYHLHLHVLAGRGFHWPPG